MIKHDAILRFSKSTPKKLAIVDDNGGVTWEQYEETTNALVAKVSSLIPESCHSPILFLSKNSKEIVMLGSAFSTLGIPFQGIDYNLCVDTIELIIRKLNVQQVFISDTFKDKYLNAFKGTNIHSLEGFVHSISKYKMRHEIPENEIQPFRSYSFTSGTTGLPKIVFRNKSFDKKRFEYLASRFSFNEQDVHLACLPMYHVSTTGWLRLFLSLGGTILIHNFVNSYRLCDALNQHKVSTALMSPLLLKYLTTSLTEKEALTYFKSLRFVITGGKSCSSALKQEAIKKLGSIVYEYYGTTETGVNTLLDPEEALQYPGSVGREFEGNHIIILDKENDELPLGATGRVAISSYMNMDGYLNQETDFVIKHGVKYLLTSDYGFKNKEQYLYITQRSNALSHNVFNLSALENEISSLNYVSDSYIHEEQGKVMIDILPNKYHPFEKIRDDIVEIAKKLRIYSLMVNVVSKLDYTLTGKIPMHTQFSTANSL